MQPKKNFTHFVSKQDGTVGSRAPSRDVSSSGKSSDGALDPPWDEF
jgi:hypothetical protein